MRLDFATLTAPENMRDQRCAKTKFVAHYKFSRGPRKSKKHVFSYALVQHDFDLWRSGAAPLAVPPQTRRYNSRIIQNQAIAAIQEFRQVANSLVRKSAVRIDDEEPGSVARYGRP